MGAILLVAISTITGTMLEGHQFNVIYIDHHAGASKIYNSIEAGTFIICIKEFPWPNSAFLLLSPDLIS